MRPTVEAFLADFIPNHGLAASIDAVYGIGGIAKQAERLSDIDLNVFVRRNHFGVIEELARMGEALTARAGLPVDFNVVDVELVENNLLNSDIFPHRNRHSLFLYELVTVPCLLYGTHLLEGFRTTYSDLVWECFKLTATLVQRFNKEFLTGDKARIDRRGAKFARYGIEFAMVFGGLGNPYLGLSSEQVLTKYPELFGRRAVVEAVLAGTGIAARQSYDLLVELTALMKQRLLHLLKHGREASDRVVVSGSYHDHPGAYFLFPDRQAFDLFWQDHDRTPDHRKIRL